MMGNRRYILKVCQDRLDYKEQKKQMQIEKERRCEEELERNDQLQILIQQVNDQAKMVGDLQTQNHQSHLQGAVGPESSGSAPRIPSSLHTPTGAYGVPAVNSGEEIEVSRKSTKCTVSLSVFAGPERILRRLYVFVEEPCKSTITTSEPCSPVFKEVQPRPSNQSL